MKRVEFARKTLLPLLPLLLLARTTLGFCGFYVGKADATLFNKASQVILVHDGDKNAVTMFSDYRGELKDFALVVPVPAVLTREQINVGDRALIDRLDNFSAPRLVEYFDPDPCNPQVLYRASNAPGAAAPPRAGGAGAQEKSLGVTVEAKYTVGEYDILILSAKESDGLGTWLKQNGYKIPKGAAKALEPYLKQKLKFFVAKVNLNEQAKSGFKFLRPLQFAYESNKFMLPIRLGMLNGESAQDMVVYAITKNGRVETTNYRTVKIPTGMDLPLLVKDRFPQFYKATFETAHVKENKKVVFLEYAWDMGWCDPCAADPLTAEELRKVGVFWVDPAAANRAQAFPGQGFSPPPPAFITRLHVRYDRDHFPEDLMFHETSDKEGFQGRYVLRHPWTKEMKCAAGETYKADLKSRKEQEVKSLALLTGWKPEDIYRWQGEPPPSEPSKKWYQNIFK